MAKLENTIDGGPAFPGLEYTHGNGCAKRSFAEGDLEQHSPGMSLRDYFAGQALSNLFTAVPSIWNDSASASERAEADAKWAELLAIRAYMLAECMIKVRNSIH